MASSSLGVIDVIIAGMLHAMKKAELHVHLEGSIGAAALMEIDPSLTREEIAANTAFTTFEGFLQAYIWVGRRLLKPEHYAIAARHLFEHFEEQGIAYAEVTLSAGMVLWKEQSLEEVYEAIWRETQRSRVKGQWVPDAVRHFGAGQGMEGGQFA